MKKAIIIALSLILVLVFLTSCEEAKHEHTWNDGEVTTAATCTEKGVKTFTCTVCKETKTEELPVDPNNHSWDEGEVTTAATCTKKGVKTYTCTACKETKTEELPVDPNNHSWDDGKVNNEGTCKEEKLFTCTLCNETKTEELPVDPSKHTWNEGEVTKAATCTEKGVKTYTCTACKKGTKTEEISEDPNNHTWDEGEVTKAATCTEKGVKTYTCTACKKETKTESIPALGHDLKDVRVEPGYINIGSITSTCQREGCDFKEIKVVEAIPLAEKWMTTSLETPEGTLYVYLAFSNKQGFTNKLYLGYPSFFDYNEKTESGMVVFDTNMDFEYSIVYTGNISKIIISNKTEDPEKPYIQECIIKEDQESGVITIENMILNGDPIKEAKFLIIPAHSFNSNEQYNAAWKNNTEHFFGWRCTDEHKESELIFVLEGKIEGHNNEGANGSCSVCGYQPAP